MTDTPPVTPPTPTPPVVKQFQSAKPVVAVQVDDDVLTVYSVLPAATYGAFTEKVMMLQRGADDYKGPDKLVGVTIQDQVKVVLDAVEMCLAPESAQRVASRIADPDHPIALETLVELLSWIMQDHFGLVEGSARPTQPTSDSPTGSAGTGAGSPENLSSPEVPTPST